MTSPRAGHAERSLASFPLVQMLIFGSSDHSILSSCFFSPLTTHLLLLWSISSPHSAYFHTYTSSHLILTQFLLHRFFYSDTPPLCSFILTTALRNVPASLLFCSSSHSCKKPNGVTVRLLCSHII